MSEERADANAIVAKAFELAHAETRMGGKSDYCIAPFSIEFSRSGPSGDTSMSIRYDGMQVFRALFAPSAPIEPSKFYFVTSTAEPRGWRERFMTLDPPVLECDAAAM